MMTYYKVKISRAEGEFWNVDIYTQYDHEADYRMRSRRQAHGLERAQEIAEQIRLQYKATEFSFKLEIDAR